MSEAKPRRENSRKRRRPDGNPAEAISDALLQPWFLSMETAKAVLRLIPRVYFSRMRWFFEDYGCLRCGKRNVAYGSNCLCFRCRLRVAYRMRRSMQRRLAHARVPTHQLREPSYINRAKLAERLLSDLAANGL